MRELASHLRDIGFRLWDPLGLADAWAAGEAMADEYDGYLLAAFSAAAKGGDIDAVADTLRRAEIRMGLDDVGSADRRALAAQELLRLARNSQARLSAGRSK